MGKVLLLAEVRLLGSLVLNIDQKLRSNFIGLLSMFVSDVRTPIVNEIVFIVLHACFVLMKENRKFDLFFQLFLMFFYSGSANMTIFEPNLQKTDSRIRSQHSLGLLLSLIDCCFYRVDEMQFGFAIIEKCVFLLWLHLDIFLNSPTEQHNVEILREIQVLKSQLKPTFNEVYISKIDSLAKVSLCFSHRRYDNFFP